MGSWEFLIIINYNNQNNYKNINNNNNNYNNNNKNVPQSPSLGFAISERSLRELGSCVL